MTKREKETKMKMTKNMMNMNMNMKEKEKETDGQTSRHTGRLTDGNVIKNQVTER